MACIGQVTRYFHNPFGRHNVVVAFCFLIRSDVPNGNGAKRPFFLRNALNYNDTAARRESRDIISLSSVPFGSIRILFIIIFFFKRIKTCVSTPSPAFTARSNVRTVEIICLLKLITGNGRARARVYVNTADDRSKRNNDSNAPGTPGEREKERGRETNTLWTDAIITPTYFFVMPAHRKPGTRACVRAPLIYRRAVFPRPRVAVGTSIDKFSEN